MQENFQKEKKQNKGHGRKRGKKRDKIRNADNINTPLTCGISIRLNISLSV